MSYAVESGDLRIALTGEAIITRGLMAYREDAFLAVATSWRVGMAVLAAWAVVVWLLGAVLFARRDV